MRRLLCLAALLLPGASLAAAQTDPRLTAAVRAAQEGQGDSARSAVERLLAATSPTDSLYPEILYTQAMVAGSAADMRRHLQRVGVEYPTSPWADDALLRLVQMDYATRSFEGAARNLERLRLDYPLTPLLAQAAYWGGRTYFELKDTTRACRWLADGVATAGTDVELQRQLGFLYQRCAALPRDVATADTARGGADSASRRALMGIQLYADFATPGAADDAATKAERLGYPAVILRERGYYKVRAGAFATRKEAQAAMAKLKARMGGSPFVVAEP